MIIIVILVAILLYLLGVAASYVFTVVYYYHRPEKITYYWFDPPPKDYKTNKEYKLKAARYEAEGCVPIFLFSWVFFVIILLYGCVSYLLSCFISMCDKTINKLIK